MAKILGRHTPNFQKNLLINGDMAIAQRGTSFTGPADNTYTLDRFLYRKNGAVVQNITQDTDVPTLAQVLAATGQPYLFQKSLRLNLTTPDTAIAAGDYCLIQQKIEGYNIASIAQRTFTFSFWVKATLPGNYCVAFTNSGNDRSYVADYTINAASSWEYKTIVVPASPSAGTWDYTNGIGMFVQWALAVGSTFQTTSGAWQTGNFFGTSNQINGVNTGATDFRITGAVVNAGSAAAPFSLFGNSTGEEIQACQRYYEKSYAITTNPGTATLNGMSAMTEATADVNNMSTFSFKVKKRTAPITVNFWDAAGSSGVYTSFNGAATQANGQTGGYWGNIAEDGLIFRSTTGTGRATAWVHWAADAEL